MGKGTPAIGKSWVDKLVATDSGNRWFKKLQQVGNSYALFLPKIWVDFMCHEDNDGKYWVEIKLDANKITIIGIKELP